MKFLLEHFQDSLPNISRMPDSFLNLFIYVHRHAGLKIRDEVTLTDGDFFY